MVYILKLLKNERNSQYTRRQLHTRVRTCMFISSQTYETKQNNNGNAKLVKLKLRDLSTCHAFYEDFLRFIN